MKRSGIYYITNKVNNKSYIGSSVDLDMRKSKHFGDLRRGTHANAHLQNSFNKYGSDNFIFEVAEEVPALHVSEVENQYLALAKLVPIFYYNLAYHAKATLKGRKFSEEHRRKISEANFGKKRSEEFKARMRGRFFSPETRRKLSDWQLGEKSIFYGKPKSEEHRRKIGDSQRGEKNHNYGKRYTRECRKKISQQLLTRTPSHEISVL